MTSSVNQSLEQWQMFRQTPIVGSQAVKQSFTVLINDVRISSKFERQFYKLDELDEQITTSSVALRNSSKW
jgi:hypothetical protein